tara:strand:+ start:494 stop:1045 length:552 start_codon:yes stop_codon:yes gene_type:complete
MEVRSLEIQDVKIIKPKKILDDRGFFSETYNNEKLAQAGININFVQDNHSLSMDKGVIRGLHFQTDPFAQDKLVRVVRGSILDVAVDLRAESETYGKHIAEVISYDEWNQILVPIGFAHGFCTLEENTEVVYKVSNLWSLEHDKGLRWNDPDLEIDWPVSEKEAILSEKDLIQPFFSELPNYF